jgi:3'-phosphoadenosine 5'-phosphosulfate sulfotransferase (PAPS reductase)/FAD synthetase
MGGGDRHRVSAGMVHVVSISGGKDSTATDLRAIERGLPFQAVFADTGNEHEATYEYVASLAAKTGGPEIRWIKANFDAEFERKRAFIAANWPGQVDDAVVERALALLQPTGNPFLDLCMLKGRFPSAKARFCTQRAKVQPIFEQVNLPLLQAGSTVISWQGVRADESYARSLLPKLQRLEVVDTAADTREAERGRLYAYRPLLAWTVADVFAMHARHGITPNPLYSQGMGRVGCMPCILCREAELCEIARRFPAHIDRIEEWERIVAQVSKRGSATFFAACDDPVGRSQPGPISPATHGIRNHIEWAKTSRGGRQYQFDLGVEFGTACNEWGLCG